MLSMKFAKELIITKTCMGITLVGSGLAAWILSDIILAQIRSGVIWGAIWQGVFITFMGFIIYSALIYQFTRLGYLKRQMSHRRASQEELDAFSLDKPVPAVVFLIPSYKEEGHVIRQALISAALQEYPNRSVVLLIDDPPNPRSASDQASLATARALPMEVQEMLEWEADKYCKALMAYEDRRARGESIDLLAEFETLAQLYREAAQWFQNAASGYEVTDHTDRFFVDRILVERSQRYFEMARDLRSASILRDTDTLGREYKRLASLFRVKLTHFERKRYVNFSHEANKAMNLNSYIELMGKSFQETNHENGLYLSASPLFPSCIIP